MAVTQIRASLQIKNGTITVNKMSPNFLDGGVVWSVSTDNSGRITGLATPVNANDVATKQYIDDLFSGGVMKAPDGFATTTAGDYPSDYKGTGTVSEGDTFVITDITNGNKVGTKDVEVGDLLVAKVDAPGNDDNNWIIIQRNIDQATESTKGIARIATQTEVDAGTDDTTIVTPLKLKNTLNGSGITSVTAGAGLTETTSGGNKTIDVVSSNAGIKVNPDNIELVVGNTNGTSLEITSSGVELASTITGARTFQAGSGNKLTLDTDANNAVLTNQPDGTDPLAIATTKYVDDKVGALPTDVYGEVPTFNDGDTTVSLANTPLSGTVRVYLNGLRLLEGSGNDYTVSGNQITFADALHAGDVVQVDYKY